MIFFVLGKLDLKDIARYFILPNRGSMLVSYFPKGSVAIMGLCRYVNYESHVVISILVRIFQMITPRLCGGNSQEFREYLP